MPTYPRNCEVWEDIDTKVTFLVPGDCKDAILKAKKVRNIRCIAEFVANDKEDMMEEFYILTGRGEYKPPKNSMAKDRTFSNTESMSNSTTTIKPKKLAPLEIIRNTLNIYGADNYRRERA